jgi:TRAP-type C4-dicarboxylate transport system permease small subunit
MARRRYRGEPRVSSLKIIHVPRSVSAPQEPTEMFNQLDKVVHWLTQLTYLVGAVSVGLLMVHITLHVILQHFFGFPLPGTMLFVSNYYMVVVTFLCLAAVERKDRHISVDLLTNVMPVGMRKVFFMLAYTISILVFSVLARQSLVVANSRREVGAFELEYGVRFIQWPSYYLVPIGAALMVIVLFLKLLSLIAGQLPEPATGEPALPPE